MSEYDLVIRGGTVANAVDTMQADVAVNGGRIAALGAGLDRGRREIDATGHLVLPGGVDTHAHIEQIASNGLPNADTFESATTAAAFGGTTSVICFAAQHRGNSLRAVYDDYAQRAERGAVIDYSFHLLLTDPTPQVLHEELPPLVKAGNASIKVFMTYELMNVGDEALLDILLKARELKALVAVHAENNGMISWLGKRLVERGYTDARYHAVSHPRGSEAEAFHRLIAFSELIDQPVIIYHVATAEGAAVIREARGRGVKVFAETCTQYLFLTKHDLVKAPGEGAKWVCSPPLRDQSDQEALWQALALGDLQIITSDHAPYTLDDKGKYANGRNPSFKQTANGMPGIETRLPMLFDAMVSKGRYGVNAFVKWTATEPARLYGLGGRKGTIAIGADADIAIWDPEKSVTLHDDAVHDNTRYTPFAGRTVKGWPTTVLRRGEVIIENGACSAAPGSGIYLPREGGEAAAPSGRLSPEFDPERNFGADLY
ncbi:MAG: dihydropyrimidinase [Alphaproteobacteria bacterium]|nr:dihydropyrimidinase [Alphaproteobacteria bacterium]